MCGRKWMALDASAHGRTIIPPTQHPTAHPIYAIRFNSIKRVTLPVAPLPALDDARDDEPYPLNLHPDDLEGDPSPIDDTHVEFEDVLADPHVGGIDWGWAD